MPDLYKIRVDEGVNALEITTPPSTLQVDSVDRLIRDTGLRQVRLSHSDHSCPVSESGACFDGVCRARDVKFDLPSEARGYTMIELVEAARKSSEPDSVGAIFLAAVGKSVYEKGELTCSMCHEHVRRALRERGFMLDGLED